MKEAEEEERRMKEMYNLEEDTREFHKILVKKLTPSERAILTRIAGGLGFTQETLKQKMATMVQKNGEDDDAKKGVKSHHADGIISYGEEEEGLRLRSKKVVIKKQPIIEKNRKASSDNDDDDRDYVPPLAMVDISSDCCVDFLKKNQPRISTPPPPRLSLPLLDSQLPYKKRRISNGIALSEPLSKEERLLREKSLKKPMILDDETSHSLPKQAEKATNNFTNNKNISTGQLQTPLDIPIEIRNKIIAMGGTGLKLVIHKQLSETDLNPGEGRLSIPIRQVRAQDFLTEEEKAFLDTKQKDGVKKSQIKVEFIDPNGQSWSPSLKKWDMMKKVSRVNNPMYVLVSEWNKIAQSNKLKPYNVIQLWYFRNDSKLCFVLVKIGGARKNNGSGNKGDNSRSGGASTSQSKNTSMKEK